MALEASVAEFKVPETFGDTWFFTDRIHETVIYVILTLP